MNINVLLLLSTMAFSCLAEIPGLSHFCSIIHEGVAKNQYEHLIAINFAESADYFYTYALTECIGSDGTTIFHTWARYNPQHIPQEAFMRPEAFLANHARHTPLMIAIQHDNRNLITQYLGHMTLTHLNQPDETGRTALHYAGRKGNLELLRTLSQLGGDGSIRDINGKYPHNLASQAIVTGLSTGTFSDTDWDDESSLNSPMSYDDITLAPARNEPNNLTDDEIDDIIRQYAQNKPRWIKVSLDSEQKKSPTLLRPAKKNRLDSCQIKAKLKSCLYTLIETLALSSFSSCDMYPKPPCF